MFLSKDVLKKDMVPSMFLKSKQIILGNFFATASLFDLVMIDKRKRVIYSIENKYRNTRENIEAKRSHSVRFRPIAAWQRWEVTATI